MFITLGGLALRDGQAARGLPLLPRRGPGLGGQAAHARQIFRRAQAAGLLVVGRTHQADALDHQLAHTRVLRRLDHRVADRHADVKQGMVLNEVSPEERARMRQRLQPVVDKYTKQVGEELVKQAMAEIGKVRVATK